MAILTPLRGLRFSAAYARPSAYAPPYDVISPASRQQLLASDPHSIVHLDLGPEGADAAWYEHAAATLAEWRAQGVLAQDDTPSVYGYEQRYTVDGRALSRRGVLGAVRLAPWGQGIHPHERTRSGPRADRLRLMRATRAQLSPVFGLLHDAEGALSRWALPPEQCALDFDAEGVRHRFWPIADAAAIAALCAAVAECDIVIADGHHRYETALAYRDERRAAQGHPVALQPYDHVLMYLCDVDSEGLTILPTHRAVTCPADISASALLARLRGAGTLTPWDGGQPLAGGTGSQSPGDVRVGVYLGKHGAYLLTLHDVAVAVQRAAPDVPMELAGLDVLALQYLVLEPLLGISPEELAHSERVRYTIHEAEARAWVDAGTCQAAFILNPTTVAQVWQAATRGLTMPPKSTYFYPKLLTGLVIHALD